MSFIDWLIVVVPVIFVIGVGVYSRRYIRGVVDFLSAGRLCGRYVICASDVAKCSFNYYSGSLCGSSL